MACVRTLTGAKQSFGPALGGSSNDGIRGAAIGWSSQLCCSTRWSPRWARYVLAAANLHADDTPVKVLAPGNGKTKIGRLWVYVRDDWPARSLAPAAASYRYLPDREGLHAN